MDNTSFIEPKHRADEMKNDGTSPKFHTAACAPILSKSYAKFIRDNLLTNIQTDSAEDFQKG